MTLYVKSITAPKETTKETAVEETIEVEEAVAVYVTVLKILTLQHYL